MRRVGSALMKKNRQKLILELISRQPVETQQQLQTLLEENGVHCTQATLSRDLHALGLVKQAEPNGLIRYSVNPLSMEDDDLRRLMNIARMGAVSAQAAQNIIVIRPLPGLANAVGSYVDKSEQPGLVGSLAGNDTILLVMKDNDAAGELLARLQELLEGKRSLP